MSDELRFMAWCAAVSFWIAATHYVFAHRIDVGIMLITASFVHGILGLWGRDL